MSISETEPGRSKTVISDRWLRPFQVPWPRSLRARIVLLTCALSFLAACLMGTLAYLRSAEIALETSVTRISGDTRIMAQRLDGKIRSAGDDALLIGRSPVIAGLLRSLQNGGIDAQDGSSTAALNQRLAKLLTAFMASRKSYVSVELFGIWNGGQRLLGVERGESGLRQLAPGSVWREPRPDWTRRALSQLRSGEVLISIEESESGSDMRLTTQIAHSGTPVAILTTSVDTRLLFAPLLDDTTEVASDAPTILAQSQSGQLSVISDSSSTDRANDWIAPDLASSFQAHEGSRLFWDMTDDGAYVFMAMNDLPHWLKGARFGVAQRVEQRTLLAPAHIAQRTTLLMAAALFVITLSISLVLARMITRPLQDLCLTITQADGPDALQQMDTRRTDEIGDLSRAFSGLAQRLSQAERRAQDILNAVDDGVVTFDGGGRVLSANPAALSMIGRNSIGSRLQDLIPGASVRSNSDGPESWTITREDGTTSHFEVSFSQKTSWRDGFTTAVIRDVTEAREIERMKEDFLATVSHELRTPLTAIKSALVLLRHAVSEKVAGSELNLLGLALSNTQRLARLVDDILSVEKESAGKLEYHFRPVAVSAFLRDLVDSQTSLAEAHGVSFQIEGCNDGAWIEADPDRLEQVVINLLSNAAKFSPAGSEVRIILNRPEVDVVRISVVDQGPGIAPEFRDKVFTRFASDYSKASTVQAGTGLGLSIAKKMVTKMKGDLTFDSMPGHGARFHIDLPLQT